MKLEDLNEYQVLLRNFSAKELEVINSMWGSLLNTVVFDRPTSLIYWMEQMKCPVQFNKFLLIMKDYLEVRIKGNWADIRLCTARFNEEELKELRMKRLIKLYMPIDKSNLEDNVVIIKGKKDNTGLKRVGFKLANQTEFSYDSETLKRYKKEVLDSILKSVRDYREFSKIDDALMYEVVTEKVLDKVIEEDTVCTLGNSYIDSRGRAIVEGLQKPINPISNKLVRAMLVF